MKRLVTLGFAAAAVADRRLREITTSIGRFEGEPSTGGVEAARADGGVSARQGRRHVLGGAAGDGAFSDDMIRAVVATGQYSEPPRSGYLADVLIKRRDAIGRAYLPAINPIMDPALDGAALAHVPERRGRRARRPRAGELPGGHGSRSITRPARAGRSARPTPQLHGCRRRPVSAPSKPVSSTSK